MSDSNYVPNASNTSQQHETLGPDGSEINEAPDTDVNKDRKGQWEIYHNTSLPPFKWHPVRPELHSVPTMCGSTQPMFLVQPTAKASSYPVADTVRGDGRWAQITPPGNPVARSLVRTQVWQNNVLREHSKLKQ